MYEELNLISRTYTTEKCLRMFVIPVLGRGKDRQIHMVHWLKIQWDAPEEQQPMLTHTHATHTPTYIHLPKCEHTTPHTHTQKVDDDLDVINAKLA